MQVTSVSISGDRFLINGRLVYDEIPGVRPEARGLLMNARFIQGVFDDKADRGRYDRFDRGPWDPEKVDHVEFFRNGALYYTCYDEPFMVHWNCNFDQAGVETQPGDREWRAVVHLRDGRRIEKKETLR